MMQSGKYRFRLADCARSSYNSSQYKETLIIKCNVPISNQQQNELQRCL